MIESWLGTCNDFYKVHFWRSSMRSLSSYILLLTAFIPYSFSEASPFEECPGSAYLVQGSDARVYGVNLATGFYQLLSDDLGTSSKINAIGFNIHDRYIYGYGNEWNTLVRINSRFESEPLELLNSPDTQFYVGDISLVDNRYYAYRPGENFGFYSVDLDPQSENYLNYIKIINGLDLNLAIYDFAFHPRLNVLYAVDRIGNLVTIFPETGEYNVVANVGESGVFGAVYFDADEYFYISRNNDGHIFRINLGLENPTAEFFSFGPSSSNNDGARCAEAGIISGDNTVDFGNAPASYGSDIESNGARHEVSENLFIGSSWGGEDDGVEFITNIEPGLSSIIVTKVEGEGILNAWGDWNQNGAFEDSEQFITNQSARSGDNFIKIDVPDTALPGETWSRVRYSSQLDIGANGGVPDGEVEDYRVDVVEAGTSVVHYPSSSGFVTLAYEDNWPVVGDYDMNDVVVALQTSQFSSPEENTLRYEVQGKVLALGAGYHNGFAIQLDNIPTNSIDTVRTELYINGVLQILSPLEDNADQDDAVLIISNDLKSALPALDNCQYYRTERNCENFEENRELTFNLLIFLSEVIPVSSSPSNLLNPFVFATPGIYHGDSFVSPPGRGLEIHLKNKKVTSRFNTLSMGLGDDRSNIGHTSFITENGMPWAMEVPGVWSHPVEKQDLLLAYPKFKDFVESDSTREKGWYSKANRNEDFIIENVLEN